MPAGRRIQDRREIKFKPMNDTIIDEIYAIRRQISDKFNGNISAIVADAKERQEADGRPEWKGVKTPSNQEASTTSS